MIKILDWAKKYTSKSVVFLLGSLWLIFVLAPIYFMVLSSLRRQGTYVTANPWVPSGPLTLHQYYVVFHSGLGTYLVNSLLITAACIILSLALSLSASFRIIRGTSRFSKTSLRLIVFGLAIPIQAIIIPIYVIIDKLGLYDTLTALILVMTASAIPVSVLIMVSYVRDIPRELIDAMATDGANEWVIFRRLILPLSGPVLATVGIYNGINVWNNFLVPLVLTQSNSTAVLPLGLYKFQSQFGIDVPAVMAAVLLSAIPLLILYIGMRKQFIRGLSGIAMR
jgi:ABC-type glycerol-3-phosphate transport system permease component